MEFNQDEVDKFLNEKPMSKSHKVFFWICFCSISIIIIWFIVSFLFINKKYEPTIYEQKVKNYLLDEKEYKEDEIKSIEENGGIGSLPARYVIVTFENEPFVEYTYYAHNEVKQASYYITDEIHKEITKEDLKNYDPDGLIDS